MLITLIFFILLSPTFTNNNSFEHRCLWVVRYSLTSKESIDKMLKFAVSHQFNHLFVQVRGRGDSLYQSSWVPKSEILTDSKFDPLEYVIKEAQKLQIKVHGWVNVYMLWSAVNKPNSPDHIFNRHPEWVDAVEEESQKYYWTPKRLGTDLSGREGFYLAPHHPEVNPYLFAVFKELVNKYDLDGLHLDYIRYKNEKHGFNPVAMNRFDSLFVSQSGFTTGPETSFSNLHLNKHYLKYWEDYLLNSITELVIKLNSYLRNLDKEMILSSAVKPNIVTATDLFYQEWNMWLTGGIIDWVVVMNYNPSFITFIDNILMMTNQLNQFHLNKIIMGVALYNQSADEAVKKIKYSEKIGFCGLALFSYNVLIEDHKKLNPVLAFVNETP